MMQRLDTFIDTKAKRAGMLMLLAQLSILLVCITYVMLAIRLIQCRDYQDVFALLQRTEVSMTYVSRIVVTLIGKASIDIIDVCSALVTSLRGWEVIAVLLWMGMCKLNQPSILQLGKYMKYAVFICGSMSCIILGIGFLATTLLQVVYALKALGAVLLVFSIACSILCLYMIITIALPWYREALAYEVVEIVKD